MLICVLVHLDNLLIIVFLVSQLLGHLGVFSLSVLNCTE